MVSHYFEPRWNLFIDYLKQVMQYNSTYNETFIRQTIFTNVEEPFTFDTTSFPTTPTGELFYYFIYFFLKLTKTLCIFYFSKNRKKTFCFEFVSLKSSVLKMLKVRWIIKKTHCWWNDLSLTQNRSIGKASRVRPNPSKSFAVIFNRKYKVILYECLNQ